MKLIDKLNFYLTNQKNVLLIGPQGVGKTALIQKSFDDAGLKWKYFSAPTLDPWVNFIGVPKEVDNKLEFILPKDFEDDAVEAIYMDELNRAPKQIRNAVMELIQFKSINGRKFNNLKVIWASINPEDDSYDTERLDPALKSRFHAKIEVPNTPDSEYFIKKFGASGERALEWWSSTPIEARDKFSPRDLDYAIECFELGGDIKDVLPKDINTASLIKYMSTGSLIPELKEIFNNGDTKKAKKFVNENFEEIDKFLFNNPKYLAFYAAQFDKERVSAILTDQDKLNAIFKSSYEGNRYKDGSFKVNAVYKSIKNNHAFKAQEIFHQVASGNKKLHRSIYEAVENSIPKVDNYDFDLDLAHSYNIKTSNLKLNKADTKKLAELEDRSYNRNENIIDEYFSLVTSKKGEFEWEVYPNVNMKVLDTLARRITDAKADKYMPFFGVILKHILNGNQTALKNHLKEYIYIWRQFQPFGLTQYAL